MQYDYFKALTMCLCIGFIFTSCDDNEDEDDSNGIVGTWTWTVDTYSGCDDSDDNEVFTITCTEIDCFSYTFNSDETWSSLDIFEGEEDVLSGTYSTDGSNLTLTLTDDGVTATFSLGFEIDGDTMLLDLGTSDFDGCLNVETYARQ